MYLYSQVFISTLWSKQGDEKPLPPAPLPLKVGVEKFSAFQAKHRASISLNMLLFNCLEAKIDLLTSHCVHTEN